MTEVPVFDDLSSAELRLDLAEAVASRPRTWREVWLKKDRIRDLTNELIKRGSF
jgi:hypothetical protein